MPYATFGTWKKLALAKNRISKTFILYDPLEFSTGACLTPSGLEMAKTHHCAVADYCLKFEASKHPTYLYFQQGKGPPSRGA